MGRGVKAIAPQLHTLAVRVLHGLIKAAHLLGCAYLGVHEHHFTGQAAICFGDALSQVVAYLQCGTLGRTAIQIGTAGGSRCTGIGDFVGVGAADANVAQGQTQYLRDDGTHLGVQALAHFSAAMVDPHAAIGIDSHQGTGLVELGGGEADAKFHGGEGDTALEDGAAGVEATNLVAPPSVITIDGELRHEARQDVVFHRHAIGCGVARCVAIQVAQTHIQWVELQLSGDVAHHGFNQQHALRPAKATKRGMALGVEFDAV